jgi:hypothetical protein
MRLHRRAVLTVCAFSILVVGLLYTSRALLGRDERKTESVTAQPAAGAPNWLPERPRIKAAKITEPERSELLRRAHVWRKPATAIEQVSFTAERHEPKEVVCRFRVTELGGTTPKFDCNLESGELIRVKYGKTGEVPAEVASTRLLRALGFGADDVEFVEQLKCYGCPEEPFSVMKAVEITRAEQLYKSLMLSYDDYEQFAWPAIERRFEGQPVETEQLSGWAMFELDTIDPHKGGAPRKHVDALRLLAVFLAHWDNKADNQRLVCLSEVDPDHAEQCERPFLLLQDVGSTFGPAKVDLDAWKKAPIWEDRSTCLTSMRELPFNGATFGQARISEEGRRFLADMLTGLSDRQLVDLFTTSRFDDELGLMRRSSPIADWVSAFKSRVRLIADGPPCPGTT